MLERIKAAWRTPVPPVIKFIAMGAVVVTGLTIPPTVVAGPVSNMTYVVGFVVGALTVLTVLVVWRIVEGLRSASR